MKNLKIAYVLSAVILVVLVVAMAFNYLQRSAEITKSNSVERPATVKEKETVTEKTVNDNITTENFYRVQLQLNPGVSEPKPDESNGDYSTPNLGDYLVNILQLGKPISYHSFNDIIYLIAYDSTQKPVYGDNNYKFNHDYFILLKPEAGILDLQKTYKTTEFSAVVSKANPKLLPFIQDSSYCEVNTDCSVALNFCNYASYNKFRVFIDVYGCEYEYYPQENEKKLSAMCPPATDPMVSPYEVKYTGSKCISNKCVAQNREVKCVSQVLP